MARKLPWARNDEKLEPVTGCAKTPDSHHTGRSQPEASSAHSRRQTTITPGRKRSRSRSTSPPPGPPTVEPMQDGFDGDDIWMIVEDELQTVAQSFTAHLHHLEYKRLVKKAKDAPTKTLPTATSPMSKDAKRRLQRDILQTKQQKALERVGAGPTATVAEEQLDDPWRGTSIAGLIASGSQEKRSLKGLDRLPSSTRAARGFGRPENGDPPGDNQGQRIKKRIRGQDESVASEGQADIGPFGDANIRSSTDTSRFVAAREDDFSRQPTKDTRATSNRSLATSFLSKRKKAKKEPSREDRLAEVPTFL
ncbi:uncharacterized protein HMPREF1541_10039 [Cyphellophora europaea CBS 101466]|uniref:Uncharacterized protein n=1 Tax=Cyphellophora europaea (strain CBS 101466) TaxID=1220924 RepID=W2S905_CYPE1|nr:uncharacterized protein HMPREF1541_10039 [Cyphellophora europaea CBS 101466]ETN45162.1 hypothetical protein HMPREF1541_10039 [Cyphellophora europaea CBS 101466]